MKKLGSPFLILIVLAVSGCAMKVLPEYKVKPASEYKQSDTKEGLSIAVYPILDEKESETYFGTNLLKYRILAVMVTAENAVGNSSKTLFPKTFSFAKGQDHQDSTKASDKLDTSDPSDPKEEPLIQEEPLSWGKKAALGPGGAGGVVGMAAWMAVVVADAATLIFVSPTIFPAVLFPQLPVPMAAATVAIIPPLLVLKAIDTDVGPTEIKTNLEQKELRSKTLSAGKQTNGFVYFKFTKDSLASSGAWTMRVNAVDMKNEAEISFDFEVDLDRLKNDDK